MFDIGLSSAGTSVSLVSSSDPKYPPENIIDGKSDTFWLTTGMYPQEFIVTFASAMTINNIKLKCHNVRRLSLQKSVQVCLHGVHAHPCRVVGNDNDHDYNCTFA